MDLILKGVRQNNLKNIDLSLPRHQAIVVTGPSGSGKSSLAFETIYAEGQRRYLQCLSTYARQFLEKFKAPLVDKIENIPPTIAIEQINPVRNSRATVGTITEIYDHLRLLYEKIGVEYCAGCQTPMVKYSYRDLAQRLFAEVKTGAVILGFEKELPSTAEEKKQVLEELMQSGYSRVFASDEIKKTEAFLLERKQPDKVIVVQDRVKLGTPDDSLELRLLEAIRNAIHFGRGYAAILTEENGAFKVFDRWTNQTHCPKCHKIAIPKTATSFSFNNPLGACQTCKGFGNTLDVDPELVIPNPNLTLSRGAIDPIMKPSLRHWHKKLLKFCESARIDCDLPYKELSAEHKKLVFEGGKGFPGVRGIFKELEEEKYKLRIRVFVSRYTSPFTCPSCKGKRLNEAALQVKVGEKTIAELCDLSVEKLSQFFADLSLKKKEKEIAIDILSQLDRRLKLILKVGLGYLTLSRHARTLSGGEYQRILLATQLSQGLTDTLYVLDEPSIGLHPKDTQQLLSVLGSLKDQGNSLVIVEHDPEVIEWADHIVELGPHSGTRGGHLIFTGDQKTFGKSEGKSADAIRTWKEVCVTNLNTLTPRNFKKWLEVKGAKGNNLKGVDVSIPLQGFVAVTGVSGSGKSTLVVDTIYNALAKIFHGKSEKISRFSSLRGFEFLSSVELVDQSPIGRSSRSNPITFIKGYDEIRSLFAQTTAGREGKLTPGHFSFNVSGGRCDNCEGEGRVKIEMVFMEDVWVPCQVCDEKRFKPHVLAVKLKQKNIYDVLQMTVDDAYFFFEGYSNVRNKLSLLRDVGLGYITLGQPGYTLSGGEAQRIKIARELGATLDKRGSTLFVLDEPTTGLHFNEVEKLIRVLRKLVERGHSVFVIEHNLQLICAADYLIDLGPDGGECGGQLIAVGTPKEIAMKKLPQTGKYLADILNL